MIRIITFVVAYLLIGFIVEIEEEWIVCKHAREWFVIPEDMEFPRFEDRFKNYSFEMFKYDTIDVFTWPIGLIFWIRGIQKAKGKKIDINEYI